MSPTYKMHHSETQEATSGQTGLHSSRMGDHHRWSLLPRRAGDPTEVVGSHGPLEGASFVMLSSEHQWAGRWHEEAHPGALGVDRQGMALRLTATPHLKSHRSLLV